MGRYGSFWSGQGGLIQSGRFKTESKTGEKKLPPVKMSRKRDKPYPSRHVPTSASKRRRPLPPPPPEDEKPVSKPIPPPAVVVMGLPSNCSVLDLKSRFEIYGSISRIRIDRNGVGYITYRTKDSAEAAIAAALDSSFGVTVDSHKVQSPHLSVVISFDFSFIVGGLVSSELDLSSIGT